MERGVLGGNYPYENGVVMSRDPKPRLRWTADLHHRFVDAVTKLGGPDSKFLLPLLFTLFSISKSYTLFGNQTQGRKQDIHTFHCLFSFLFLPETHRKLKIFLICRDSICAYFLPTSETIKIS